MNTVDSAQRSASGSITMLPMGMAEDAAKLRNEQAATNQREAEQEAARQRRNWDEIDQAVREFIPLAKQNRLATTGLTNKRWVIGIHSYGGGRLAATTSLTVFASGAWSLSYYDPDRYTTPNKPSVNASSKRPWVCTETDDRVNEVRSALTAKLAG